MPSLSDLLCNFQHEAFPPLVPALLRIVVSISGNSDLALRIFGTLVGLAIIAALWWNLGLVRRSVPLLGLALLGFNSALIQWGDSVRGYGLGTLFIILTLGLIWRVVEKPTFEVGASPGRSDDHRFDRIKGVTVPGLHPAHRLDDAHVVIGEDA